jgi:hypothetical protein
MFSAMLVLAGLVQILARLPLEGHLVYIARSHIAFEQPRTVRSQL